jgi:hypothetical protein
LQPYRGKPAVRNERGDRGNVGIIRSPLRASILPDRTELQFGMFGIENGVIGHAPLEIVQRPRIARRAVAVEGLSVVQPEPNFDVEATRTDFVERTNRSGVAAIWYNRLQRRGTAQCHK